MVCCILADHVLARMMPIQKEYNCSRQCHLFNLSLTYVVPHAGQMQVTGMIRQHASWLERVQAAKAERLRQRAERRMFADQQSQETSELQEA